MRLLAFIALIALLLFLAAGTVDWRMGWICVVLLVAIAAISRYLMIRRSPGLLIERSNALGKDDTKSWDKIFVPVMAMMALAQLIVAGLDFRYDWSTAFSIGLELLGVLLLIVGYVFASWPMLVNPYFSSTVRIQKERGQQVVTDGPYRIVRHPSYLGTLVGSLGTSLMLSSLWSLIPAAALMITTIARASLEDATLCDELPGYRQYAQQTRYRLFPGIW